MCGIRYAFISVNLMTETIQNVFNSIENYTYIIVLYIRKVINCRKRVQFCVSKKSV